MVHLQRPKPGFLKFVQDKILLHHHISTDIGRVKNANKNPAAEKVVQELKDELLELWMQQDQITHQQLPMNDQKVIQEQNHCHLASNNYYNQYQPPTIQNP